MIVKFHFTSKLVAMALLLVAVVSASASAVPFENSFHTMTAGDFGIVFIDSSGQARQSNGVAAPTALPLATTAGATGLTRVLGADLFGDGGQELIYVDNFAGAGPLRMFYHDFGTGVDTVTGGSSVTDISAGKFSPGDTFDTVFLGTIGPAGDGFTYTSPSSGNAGTFTGGFGQFETVTSGDFVPGNGVDEFAVVNSATSSFIFTPGVGFAGPTGSTFNEIVAADIVGDPAADIWLTNTGTTTFVQQDPLTDGTFLFPPGTGTKLSAGDIDGAGDKGYIIGSSGGIIYQLNAAANGFTSAFAGNNSGFVDFILADLLHGDGLDEIYARRADNSLYRFDPATASPDFQIVAIPEPSTIALATLGLIGLIGMRRRKR